MSKVKIVRDAIRRFYHLPTRTISRHILATHGDLFENDLEKIRGSVRYQLGKAGKGKLARLADKSLVRAETPTKMPQTWRKIRTHHKLDTGLWLVLSDTHVPFHEPMPIEAAVQAGQAEKVDGIFLNGDIFDCAAVSYWPTAYRDFNKELEAAIDFFDWLRGEFPGKPIIYKPGNHEYRLPRYFMSKAPELAESPLAQMETAIGFEERDIEFLDYFQIVSAGMLPVLHGHEVRKLNTMVNPARGLFLRTKTFAACSHCHRTSTHPERNLEGKDLTCHSFGCLCDLSPDYDPYTNNWNWGFGLINVEKDGNFEVINRRILPNGKVV
jgi:predicted phosphodiesterase